MSFTTPIFLKTIAATWCLCNFQNQEVLWISSFVSFVLGVIFTSVDLWCLYYVPKIICFMKGPICVLYLFARFMISRNGQSRSGTVCEFDCMLAGMSVEVLSLLHVWQIKLLTVICFYRTNPKPWTGESEESSASQASRD